MTMPDSTDSRAGLRELVELRDRLFLPGMKSLYSQPLELVAGQMQYVFDGRGKRYLDAFAAIATISVGHANPEVVASQNAQNARLQHVTTLYHSAPMIRAAQRILALAAPAGLERVFFTNSGTEATELAVAIAKRATDSHEIIALHHSFHGRTLMAMSLTGQSVWRNNGPYASGVHHVPSAYCYRCPLGLAYPSCGVACAKLVEQTVQCATPGKIAAFYAEPIQGNGGVIDPPPEYFPLVYDIVRRAGGVTVSDEVQTGLGRTGGGKFLAIEHWGVKPDLVTMAKGLGNGYPVGAVLMTSRVAEPMRNVAHFSTFANNPVASVTVDAVLKYLTDHALDQNATRVGAHLKGGLEELALRHPLIGDVRGKGLMLGVELVTHRESKAPAAKQTALVLDLARERGVLLGQGGILGNVIRIKPPLIFTCDNADETIKALDESLIIAERASSS
jgi:4-aminobutyrate aminotransferase-like enzyme